MKKLIIPPIWFDSLGAKSSCTLVKTPDVNVLTIPELSFSSLTVKYPEGFEFKFGNTTLRFSKPLLHGIGFSRVGWLFYFILLLRMKMRKIFILLTSTVL